MAYVIEHRLCAFVGNLLLFNSNNAPFKEVLSVLQIKNEAQRQHFSKVWESVNDESWFGFKSKSLMTVPLVVGQCVKKAKNMLSEWINDCRTENKILGPHL